MLLASLYIGCLKLQYLCILNTFGLGSIELFLCLLHVALGLFHFLLSLLGSQFGLYVEPTLSYYFDNGSQIPTIYQEKPFDFGFTVGLRFSFR